MRLFEKTSSLMLFAGVVLLSGCTKSNVPAVAPVTPSQPAASAAPAADTSAAAPATPAPPGAPAAQPAPADSSATTAPADGEAPDLNKLTAALQGFAKEYNFKPVNFAPLVEHGYLAAEPKAPPGMKFVIDPNTYRVSLVHK